MAYVNVDVDIDLDEFSFDEILGEIEYRIKKKKVSPKQIKALNEVLAGKTEATLLEDIILNEAIAEARKRLTVFEIEQRLK